MKNLCISSLIALVSLASTSIAKAENRVVVMKPEFVFTPKSFDSNDNAQVVIAGAFTGYCMKVGSTDHRVDLSQKKIYIDQKVSMTGNCNDLEMYIPYSTVINLGSLPVGNFDVLALSEDGSYSKMATLPVRQAKSNGSNGTDERLYAPVSSVDFVITPSAVNPLLTIKGVFTNICLALDSIQVNVRPGNVYEVLPIVKKNGSVCGAAMQPFSKTIELKNFPDRETLIHVRSMNGQSVNKVITNLDRLPR